MISRNWWIVRTVLILASAVTFLLSAILTEPNSIWRWSTFSIFMALEIVHFLCSRCPHCHRSGIRFRWSAGDAGYCNRCGKLVEWKEYQD